MMKLRIDFAKSNNISRKHVRQLLCRKWGGRKCIIIIIFFPRLFSLFPWWSWWIRNDSPGSNQESILHRHLLPHHLLGISSRLGNRWVNSFSRKYSKIKLYIFLFYLGTLVSLIFPKDRWKIEPNTSLLQTARHPLILCLFIFRFSLFLWNRILAGRPSTACQPDGLEWRCLRLRSPTERPTLFVVLWFDTLRQSDGPNEWLPYSSGLALFCLPHFFCLFLHRVVMTWTTRNYK